MIVATNTVRGLGLLTFGEGENTSTITSALPSVPLEGAVFVRTSTEVLE